MALLPRPSQEHVLHRGGEGRARGPREARRIHASEPHAPHQISLAKWSGLIFERMILSSLRMTF